MSQCPDFMSTAYFKHAAAFRLAEHPPGRASAANIGGII